MRASAPPQPTRGKVFGQPLLRQPHAQPVERFGQGGPLCTAANRSHRRRRVVLRKAQQDELLHQPRSGAPVAASRRIQAGPAAAVLGSALGGAVQAAPRRHVGLQFGNDSLH